MQIKVHTDNHITGDARLEEYGAAQIRAAVERFQDAVTRVDAHLADENGGEKSGADKRCTLEAHLAGQPAVAVTHHAATIREALAGAVSKLEKVLAGIEDRRRDKRPS